MALKLRRGTNASRQETVFAQGEPVFVTDTGELYIGDGTTQGGVKVSASLFSDNTPTLAGDLDLAGNNIIGTGNINISGTIRATGDINLGDGNEDSIKLTGFIDSDLIPLTSQVYNLGSENNIWNIAWLNNVNTQNLSASLVQVQNFESSDIVSNSVISEDGQFTNIIKADSSVLYQSSTDTLSANINTSLITNSANQIIYNEATDNISVNSINSNLIGSVYQDDSTLIVDSSSGIITAIELNMPSITVIESTIQNTSSNPLAIESTAGLRLNNDNIDGAIDSNLLVQNAARTIDTTLQPVNDNDYIGGFATTSYNGAEFVPKGLISSSVTATTGSSIPSKMELFIEDNNGDFLPVLSLNPDKSVSASIFRTGIYANDGERDSDISNPQVGMIIFNQKDDSTGVPTFQGYDGNFWVDFF